MADGKSVLVVEDEADIRDALVEVLDGEGYRVQGAANGLEALRLLETGMDPDLILLDLMMPVMNGSEFVQSCREKGAAARAPIIVMSADTQTASKAMGLGLQTYLKKPVDLDELLGLVERHSTQQGAMACGG